MELTQVPREFTTRYLNDGFSGGEKKRTRDSSARAPAAGGRGPRRDRLRPRHRRAQRRRQRRQHGREGKRDGRPDHHPLPAHPAPRRAGLRLDPVRRPDRQGGRPRARRAARARGLRLDPATEGASAAGRNRWRCSPTPRSPPPSRSSRGKASSTSTAPSTAQKPRVVVEAIEDLLLRHNANVHRGTYPLAVEATELYEGARERVAAFTGSSARRDDLHEERDRGDQPRRLLLGPRATSARATRSSSPSWSTIRTSSRGSCSARRPAPTCATWTWTTRAASRSTQLDEHLADGRVRARRGRPRVERASGRSSRSQRSSRALTPPGHWCCVDGAQAVPQMPVDVGAIGADFYAWTGHKAYGPTGVGVLHGRAELLDAMPPFLGGGHMIRAVELRSLDLGRPAGEVRGRHDADRRGGRLWARRSTFLAEIGMERVRAHERDVTAYALERLARGSRAGDPRPARRRRERGALVSFALDGRSPARRRRDPRSRGGLRPRRPPLRAAADAPARRARHDARVVRRAQHARRRRPCSSTGSRACARSSVGSSRMDDALSRGDPRALQAAPQLGPDGVARPGVRGRQPALRGRAEGDAASVGDDGVVEDVRFDGHGCAISQAAASMVSDEVKGMKVDDLAAAGPRLRAGPARHPDLGHPDEVRAALAEGAQERGARRRGGLGAGDAGGRGSRRARRNLSRRALSRNTG